MEAFARDPWTGTTFRVERGPEIQRSRKMAAILDEGNQAMRWLAGIRAGGTIQSVLIESIEAMEAEETRPVSAPVQHPLG